MHGSMDGFRADGAAFDVTSGRLHDVLEELGEQYRRAKAQLDELLEASWRGEAARAFGDGWQQWQRGYTESTSALAQTAQLLKQTGADYAEADLRALDRLRGAATALA